MATAILFFGSAALILFMQCFGWLKEGVWESFSALDALQAVFRSEWRWIHYPTNWIGVHKILSWLPACFATLPAGIAIDCVVVTVGGMAGALDKAGDQLAGATEEQIQARLLKAHEREERARAKLLKTYGREPTVQELQIECKKQERKGERYVSLFFLAISGAAFVGFLCYYLIKKLW